MEKTNQGFTTIPTHNLYSISRDGEVFSSIKNKILKGGKNNVGYPQVWLKDDNGNSRWGRVHVLVALTYVDNPNSYREVNHKDGNKLNNNYQNLQWCTRAQNQQHAHDTGLMPKIRTYIRLPISEQTRAKMSAKKLGVVHPQYKGDFVTPVGVFNSARQAAFKNNTDPQTIKRRCNNKTWLHKGWGFNPKLLVPK